MTAQRLSRGARIAIVGAGVVGLMTARFLLRLGYRPLVYDRSQEPRGASWAAAGLLMHLPPWHQGLIEPLSSQMLAFGHEEYRRISVESAQSGEDAGFGLDFGGCYLDIAGCDAPFREWVERGGQAVVRDRGAFPGGLGDKLSREGDWVYLPGYGGQLRPNRLLRGLRALLESQGVELRCEAIAEIARHGDQYSLRSEDGRRSSADAVALCAGVWTSALYPDRPAPELVPVSGHIVRYRLESAVGSAFVLGDGSGRYIVSRGDGVVLVGSDRSKRGLDCSVDNEVLAELGDFARRLLPELGQAAVEQVWVGLRPMRSASEWPVVYAGPGSVSGAPRCYAHSGHYHSGIALAPATSVWAAECIVCAGDGIDFAERKEFARPGE